MIEILTSGAPNSVQDLGRPGHLGFGVSRGGAMDRLALSAGNTMLGNATGAAAIEVAYFPFRVLFHQAAGVAVTGADCAATLDDMALPPFWTIHAEAGQTLTLSRPRAGARAYVAVGGGIDVPAVLGSRATDQKTGFGGLHGRGLERSDRLALGRCDAPPIRGAGFGAIPPAWPCRPGPEVAVRVLPVAEAESFDAASRQRFRDEGWTLTPHCNRMGFRLEGTPLSQCRPVELLSHGIVPGTVQVPPSGQPIIQMADANTAGGYPKMATVIEADQPLLAQAPPGARLRFVHTSWDEARAALEAQAAWLNDLGHVASLLRAGRA